MLEILYHDRHVAVCVKPAGLLSQDAGEHSVPGMLRTQLGVDYIGVVHRLDQAVGGLMVYALTPIAAAALSRAVREDRLIKEYQAVLRGIPKEPQACLEDLLFHDRTRNKTYVVTRPRRGVKDARLDYQVLETAGERTLVQIRLHTGRTHQIRVQFASRGLPLVGDGKYGGKCPGAALHLWSCRLTFPHPATGEEQTFAAAPLWKETWKGTSL